MDHDNSRYIRQMTFPSMGSAGQDKLKNATVLIVGIGGIGSVTAQILARAGLGNLVIVDKDIVEESNLQRQALYTEKDANNKCKKVDAAERHLYEINSNISIAKHYIKVDSDNINNLINGATIILDGLDNLETRYVINKAAIECKIPWIYSAAAGSSGIVAPIIPGKTRCLLCLFGNVSAGRINIDCHGAGIIAPAVWTISSLQSLWAIKLITNPDMEDYKITTIDLWLMRFNAFDHRLNIYNNNADGKGCSLCGAKL